MVSMTSYGLDWLRTSPGARKDKVKERNYTSGSSRKARSPYFELHAASAFSFLEGGSLPEDLVARAAELELGAVALIDRNGVYGAPRFHQAAKKAGIKALVGAELTLSTGSAAGDPPRITLLVADPTGYRNLCRLSTAMARGRPKGEAIATWELIERHSQGLHCLAGGPHGPIARALSSLAPLTPSASENLVDGSGPDSARAILHRLRTLFPRRLHVEIQRHRQPRQEARNYFLLEQARTLRIPIVATNGVRYAGAKDRSLYDILTAIRHHTTLEQAGRLLDANRERHLKSGAEMAELFADLPEALHQSVELAESLDFTLSDLGYRFPDYPLPAGETEMSYLRQITWNEARARFRPLTSRAQKQIEHELAMIERLGLAGYFLIVWDIIQFCKRERIMAQGRGSAANSAVCYALSITAVDPVKMELLFERFLSEERGEWPDIDLDLPSGDQREKVIQYVYRRYGPHGAAMTANVITYRNRSAAREVAKALGFSLEQQNKLSKQLGSWHYDIVRGDPKSLAEELKTAGFDPDGPPNSSLRSHVAPDPQHSASSGPALRRHGDRRRASGRSRPARAGGHGKPRHRPVGQGRLRRPRHHQSRSSGPGHAAGARRGHSADQDPREQSTSISPTCLRTIRPPTKCCARPTRSESFRSKAARRWRRCRATIPSASTTW